LLKNKSCSVNNDIAYWCLALIVAGHETMHFTWAAMHHWNSSRPGRPCTRPACGGRAGSLDLAAADARAGFSRAVRAWHLISTRPRPRRARQPSRFRRCYTRLPRAHRQHSCSQQEASCPSRWRLRRLCRPGADTRRTGGSPPPQCPRRCLWNAVGRCVSVCV